MAVMYRKNPKNPVDFLAKWLLNHAQVQKAAENEKKNQKEIKRHEKSYQKRLHKEEERRKADEASQAERQNKIDKFTSAVEKQHDLTDMLQSLATYLKEFSNSTAVYIGKLEIPKKQVDDADDDVAHLNEDAEQHIKFQYATSEHDYIVDQTLGRHQGITFDVFDPPAPGEEDEVKDDVIPEEDEEDGSKKETEKKEAPEKLPYNILVDEVVRNNRMHYFKVPRLGSYMAIHLEYDACLHEDAFDDGVREMINVHKRRADLEDEKAEWEKEEQLRKEQKE